MSMKIKRARNQKLSSPVNLKDEIKSDYKGTRMSQKSSSIIITDCGQEFELANLEAIDNGNINANVNYTYTIYRTPDQEYIQKKSFFNPVMNHTSVNYKLISESTFRHISTTLDKKTNFIKK